MILGTLLLSVLVAMALMALWVVERRKESTGPVSSASPLMIVSVPAVVLVLGIAGYQLIGKHSYTATWLSQQQQYSDVARQILAGAAPEDVAAQVPVGALVRVLQAEVVKDPSDRGWYILGSLYQSLDAPQQAETAARQALRHNDASPEIRLLLAQSLIDQAEGRLTSDAQEQLSWVTQRFPQHDSAWMMQAIAAERSRNYALAQTSWQALLARHDGGESAALLQRALANTQTQLARLEHFGEIQVTISGDDIPPGGTLFVFVRERGSQGQPLASRPQVVRRFPVTLTVTADDWLQRFPDTSADIVVGARYTPTRGATVEQAGLRARARSVSLPQSEPLELTLED